MKIMLSIKKDGLFLTKLLYHIKLIPPAKEQKEVKKRGRVSFENIDYEEGSHEARF